MKKKLSLVLALALASPVLAQSTNTLDELWHFQDAVPTAPGQTDLRFSFGWETGSFQGSGDQFILTPSLFWGLSDGVELSLTVPSWVGDGGDRGGYKDGNYDTNLGLLFRLHEQEGDGPAVALAMNFRIPTGNNSERFDAELRLIATHDYGDSGIRTHCNLFVKNTNGDNNHARRNNQTVFSSRAGRNIMRGFGSNNRRGGSRDLQYGVVLGADGPLCGDGSVRWVMDYMHRSSVTDGQNNWNVAEAGWEWTMNEADRLGMSFQVNLDRSTDGPNFGAIMTYAHALTY